MGRLRRTALLLTTVTALAAPLAPAHAGSCTSGYPVTDKHVANVDCPGLHPGALLQVPSKKYGEMDCVAGFFFTDQFGNRYTTVLGSCYLDYTCLEDVVTDLLPPPLNEIVSGLLPCVQQSDSEGEPVWKKKNGPPVADADGRQIGRLVYAVNKFPIDFAVIRIDKGVPVDPAVPFYGGPTRLTMARSSLTGPVEAQVFTPWHGMPEPNAAQGELVMSGDGIGTLYPGLARAGGGAPVLLAQDGAGVGYATGSWDREYTSVAPYGPALARAQKFTKLTFKLMTARQAS